MSSPPSTTALVQGAQAGKQDASRMLFARYQSRVLAYFLVVTGKDRDAAMDLTQETFLRVFRGISKLEDPERFAPWLWTTARRVATTHGTRSQRYAEVLGCFELERGVHLTPEDHHARAQREQLVHQLLSQIEDPQLARIVRLRYTDPEHTTRQIAETLEIPHGTVTVYLKRFRDRIKQKLARALRALDGQEAA